MAVLPEHLLEYRKFLVAAEQKAQEDFDKTVLSLSGGALGVSFVFLKDVLGSDPIKLYGFLLASWISWGLSTIFVLTSFFLSQLALRRAIEQLDTGKNQDSRPGGAFAQATAVFNLGGALLFFCGVCFITIFAGTNISTRGAPNGAKQTALSPASPASAASAASATTNASPR